VTRVRIPPTLREAVGGAREVEAAGADVRELLGDLAGSFGETGYLGWRTGIAADGTWTFFIAGD